MSARANTIGEVYVGEMIRNATGKWVTRAPATCPNGHPLGPKQVLVGHVACSAEDRGGHTVWYCRTCDAVTYGPPLGPNCTVIDGPAAERGYQASTQP